ncbi:DUF4123 domain-containing protein [Salinicola endophyticus]|uniref:DUF4123 domain-containing protein n=1 Tax=Salinicola endophyticus TaxID=1949083 RepID=A0AB74U5L0_9GAMM
MAQSQESLVIATEHEPAAAHWLTRSSQPSVGLWVDESAKNDLFAHMQKQLDMRLPDGGLALLRYYDPRVFTKLMQLLDEDQRYTLFGPIRYWSVRVMNERQVFRPAGETQGATS